MSTDNPSPEDASPAWTSSLLSTPPAFFEDASQSTTLHNSLSEEIVMYERLLQENGRHPFLLVRLAGCLIMLHAPGSALELYEEAQAEMAADDLMDDTLNDLVDELYAAVEEEGKVSLMSSFSGSIRYSQRWKPTREHRFPVALATLPSEHDNLKRTWTDFFGPDTTQRRQYLTDMAIQSNQIEKTFILTSESEQDVVYRGVDDGDIHADPKSEIQEPETIREVIRDTLAAYDLVLATVDGTAELTSQLICDVHRRLLNTARFTALSYPCPGDTRAITRSTVYVFHSGDQAIQFCPYNKLEDELDQVCGQTQHYLQQDFNPFAIASWIHLVLVRCHPFNDGSGRTTRLIASLPLLKAGYPPITISLSSRQKYFEGIQESYRGDHEAMIQCLVDEMNSSMNKITSDV